ncbi:AIF_HP2_G0044820.mRNA.1.CDS.1 [Saccharomyces cerevisiae]|nr:AIF_HP2_G0044820.mRNA.1.CDS.1 [Saccharomyces cerevisiae]CAI6729079.1 AIF_HP2_G0044820.mRNA.1.CDS.1 [Saccharomyces cerevisiae]
MRRRTLYTKLLIMRQYIPVDGVVPKEDIYTITYGNICNSRIERQIDELKEPQPLDFGDVRETWNCDYVVDIYPGLIATGKNPRKLWRVAPPYHLKMRRWILKTVLSSPHAHGDEVVRDIFIPAQHSNMLYSCGEDGCVKIWEKQTGPLDIPENFWDYSKK